jgi:hypothetical protein
LLFSESLFLCYLPRHQPFLVPLLLFFPLLNQLLAPILGHQIPCCVHVGMPLSSHSTYSSEVLNISSGPTVERSRSPFSISAFLASCSTLVLAFVVLADSSSARLREQLIEGSYQSGLGAVAVLEIYA